VSKVFSYNCMVESGHALVLKLSPRVGFHEMDEVYSLHHLPELPTCLSPLHLTIARWIFFLPVLYLYIWSCHYNYMDISNRQFWPKKLIILASNWSVVASNFSKHFHFLLHFLLFVTFSFFCNFLYKFFVDYFKPWIVQLNVKVVCPMLLKRWGGGCYERFFNFLFKVGLG